jgi:23S rRNA pseudouridine1911/1915/1917 synthase
MASSRSLKVEGSSKGARLDAWIARQLPELSRARVQALMAQGAIRLGGRPARPSARLRGGEDVTVELPDPVAATPRPEDVALTILHEDARLLVVDKPAGMTVHPGAGRLSGTLVNALLHHVRDLSGVGGVLRPGIVHRLDRGTSGLMVVAKDDETHRALAAQFAARDVEKEYLAIVHGVPRARQGVVEAPIGRDPVHRKTMSVRAPRGRPARSTYTVAEVLDGAALLRVRIHTGRTHQIRVHLASLGHPIAGDATYGGTRPPSSRRPASRAALEGLKRPALHAARLVFTHPARGERLEFQSPLPPDLSDLLAILRA